MKTKKRRGSNNKVHLLIGQFNSLRELKALHQFEFNGQIDAEAANQKNWVNI